MMADQIKVQIIDIMKPTQVTAAIHQKNSILLKKLYETSDTELFTAAFKKILNLTLTSEAGNIFIERTMDFLALFCTILKPNQKNLDENADCIEHPLVTEIIGHLLEASQVVKEQVRFRSCQLINKILNLLVGSDVSNDLCDKLETNLLIRLQDPKYTVRHQAVLALYRLQDPINPDDRIIPEFIRLMTSDPFAKVRLICVELIALRTDVLKKIIERIRDVDVNVRLAAYKRLSKYAEYIRISQKRLILHCGFLDTSEKVVEFIFSDLIPQWLSYFKNNILDLMKSVRLDANEKDIEETVTLFESILQNHFKSKPLMELSQVLKLDERKLISMEDLNWETACYWRVYVQFLNKNEYEDELEKVLPELDAFCKYISEYSRVQTGSSTNDFLEKQFILKQLFLIINVFDFADVTMRQSLNSLVSKVLEKVDLITDVTEVIVDSLKNSIPEINSRCQYVSEIISEIIYPMDSEVCQTKAQEKEFQLSKLMVKINCLQEDQEKAVREENFVEAERLKKELMEASASHRALKGSQNSPTRQVKKKTDIPTVIKYLDVAAGLLLSPQITELNSTLKALKRDIIQELLIHNNDLVRAKALRCYALCCIVDKECASTGIHIFATPISAYQNGEECDTQTLIICIGSVVDLLRIYGPQLVAAPDDNVLSESMDEEHERVFTGGTSLTDLIQGLVDLMDDEQYEVQEKAAWGLCQLILNDRIHSSSLISRLILKWCNPASEDNDENASITQLVGFTLEKLPFSATADQLEQAVLMTVKTLASAPKMSPLADVNIDNIASFMIALCKMSAEGTRIHANLAVKIGFEIKDNPKSRLNITWSKMLLALEIPDNKTAIKDLQNICVQIQDAVKERQVLTNIAKFQSYLATKTQGESGDESSPTGISSRMI